MADGDAFRSLAIGPYHRFADWPVKDLPPEAGIYTVWRSDEFIYVGIAGRQLAQAAQVPSLAGLRSRLNSHASGRRSGDQFCVYICDRLVLPQLSDRIMEIALGHLSLDQATKDFIRSELGFRFLVTQTYRAALSIERHIKAHGLPDVGQPLLNPSTPRGERLARPSSG